MFYLAEARLMCPCGTDGVPYASCSLPLDLDLQLLVHMVGHVLISTTHKNARDRSTEV